MDARTIENFLRGIERISPLEPDKSLGVIKESGLEAWAEQILIKNDLPTNPAMLYERKTGDIWVGLSGQEMCCLLLQVRSRGFAKDSVEDYAARVLIQLYLLFLQVNDGNTRASVRLYKGLVDLATELLTNHQ
jgi:hypothetical protein